MNLVSPERLIWLAAAAPIVAFYLLKTRLRRESVATLQFWDEVSERKRRRTISFRLRHWLSLLLQLAFVLLVVAALVDPLRSAQQHESKQWVFVIDTSASMQADLSPTEQRSRWDAAIDAALRHLEAARPGDELALVAAGGQAEVVVGMTDFPPVIREAIETLQVTDGPAELDAAIAVARRLASDPSRRSVLVFTDGYAAPRSENRGTGEADDLEWIVVGEAVDNVGITQMQVRRSFVDPTEYSVLVEWSNFGGHPAAGRLVLRQNDVLLDAYPFDLAPSETRRESFLQASADGGVVTAELQIDDALSLDNTARAILPWRQPFPITLVTDSADPFLPAVLSAMPNVNLTVADQWLPQRDDGQLTVLHRVVPDPLPRGPLLVIAPQADSALWRLQPALPETIITEQDSSLLLANVSLENVPVAQVTPLEMLPPATLLLKSAEGATVMASISQPSRRTLVLATDLAQSDLPLRVAFPVMMTNAVRWLTEGDADGHPAVATGATAELPRELFRRFSSIDAFEDGADGKEVPVAFDNETASVGPFRFAGIYRPVHGASNTTAADQPQAGVNRSPSGSARLDWTRQDDALALAVNLMDASESDLRTSMIPSEARVAQSYRGRGGGKPLWFYLTLAACGLMIGEWYLFQRRIVA